MLGLRKKMANKRQAHLPQLLLTWLVFSDFYQEVVAFELGLHRPSYAPLLRVRTPETARNLWILIVANSKYFLCHTIIIIVYQYILEGAPLWNVAQFFADLRDLAGKQSVRWVAWPQHNGVRRLLRLARLARCLCELWAANHKREDVPPARKKDVIQNMG